MDLSKALTCPSCGYDLRASGDGICPECGTQFDAEKLRQTQIPWVYRKSVGRFKAYWKTVRWVMRHPSQLADEVHRTTSFSDAQRFRSVTVGILTVPIVGALGCALYEGSNVWPRWADYVIVATAVVSFGFLLPIFLTSVQSYLYHPRRVAVETQNRSIALSYYTCAPMALIWVLGPAALIWMWVCNWKLLRIVEAGLVRKLMLPLLWLGCVIFTAFSTAAVMYATLVISTW